MKPPFVTPTDRILRAIKATLDQFDWAGEGFATLAIRHARRTFATPDQYPCLTIRYEEDAPRQSDQDQNWMSAGELGVDLRFTLEIELDTSERDAVDDEDETGLGTATAIAALAMSALKDPDGPLLALWAMGVSDRGRGEDPESTGDNARLDQAATVLYRVSSDDPSQILAQGVNQ